MPSLKFPIAEASVPDATTGVIRTARAFAKALTYGLEGSSQSEVWKSLGVPRLRFMARTLNVAWLEIAELIAWTMSESRAALPSNTSDHSRAGPGATPATIP